MAVKWNRSPFINKINVIIVLAISVLFFSGISGVCFSDNYYHYLRMWPSLQSIYLNTPMSVVVDENSNIYIADTKHHRIIKINANNQLVTKWGKNGSNTGEFDQPRGIAIDTGGFVYVVDSENCRIQKFTSDGEFVTSWGDSGEGQFGCEEDDHPERIAIDKHGFVYVSDPGNCKIQKFISDGEFVTSWGECGDGDGSFHHPLADENLV